ncbi:MAG: alpha-ribazole phosphatase [Desulfobacterales bacterium]|nr:alpha-ribazole phosphatase [Desulfobacterales bacterium]
MNVLHPYLCPSPKRTIFLVRHGRIIKQTKKQYIGQIDYPLNETGYQQALLLQQIFAFVHIDQIVSSDLSRSRETADIIAAPHKMDVNLYPEFREIDLGNWDGFIFEHIKKTYPDEYEQRGSDLSGFRPPGGESFMDLRQRVMTKFNDLVHNSDGNTIIVSHAGVIRVILCDLLGVHLNSVFQIGQHYGAVNIISYDRISFRVNAVNLIPEAFPAKK